MQSISYVGSAANIAFDFTACFSAEHNSAQSLKFPRTGMQTLRMNTIRLINSFAASLLFDGVCDPKVSARAAAASRAVLYVAPVDTSCTENLWNLLWKHTPMNLELC